MLLSNSPVPSGYSVVKPLKPGFYGPTYLIRDDANSSVHVCKVLMRERMGSKEQADRLLNHIRITNTIESEYIIGYKTVNIENEYISCVRPFIEGIGLETYIQQNLQPNHNVLFAQWKVLVRMIKYLSDKGISPVFLKPSNIFMSAEKCFIVTDILPPPLKLNPQIHPLDPYHVGFLPPEYFVSSLSENRKSIIWSLGVILWYFMTGSLPWNVNNAILMMKQLTKGEFSVIKLPNDIVSIINSTIKVDPNERISFRKILKEKPGEIGTKPKLNSPILMTGLKKKCTMDIKPIIAKPKLTQISSLVIRKRNLSPDLN